MIENRYKLPKVILFLISVCVLFAFTRMDENSIAELKDNA